MANIATLLARILSTRYGNEMRQDLHDAIEAVNDDTETALGKKLTFTNNTRKLKLLAKDDSVLSEVVIPGGGSGGGSVDSVNGLFPDENGNVEVNLDDINDVDITSVSNGDALVYDATSHKWVNGAGGGGTSDYSDLTNKPQINGVTLSGNKTSADLGISSADDVSAILNVYGSKNLNVYPYQETTKTVNGVTFRDNGDGSITVSGATTSAYAVFSIRLDGVSPFKLKKGTYKLSGCPNKSGLSIVFQFNVNGETISAVDTGSGATFTLTADAITKWCYLYVDSNVDLTTAETFYPMLRDARISDATFVPYTLTNRELTSKTSGLSNRNLLDNPWFTVNQKGFSSTTETTTAANKFIDRWTYKNSTVTPRTYTVNSDGLTVLISNSTQISDRWRETYISQTFEDVSFLVGKTVTISAIINGTLYSGTKTITDSTSTFSFFNVSLSNPSRFIEARLNMNSKQFIFSMGLDFNTYTSGDISYTIKAVKLELGLQSTLALDVAPNYTEELLKCQRYYYPLPRKWFVNTAGINQYTQVAFIPLPTKMRTTPTLSGSLDLEGAYNGASVTETVATASVVISADDLQNIYATITSTNQYDRNGWVLVKPSSGAALSAEL